MELLGVLLFLGALSSAFCRSCIGDTLRCLKFKVAINTHSNLAETPQVLDKLCRHQEQYYECLTTVASSCEKVDSLPDEIYEEMNFFKELCTEGSTWRTRYLEEAACINKQTTDYCTSTEFASLIASGSSTLMSRCKFEAKRKLCISTILGINCSHEASLLYSYLLKFSELGNWICEDKTPELDETVLDDALDNPEANVEENSDYVAEKSSWNSYTTEDASVKYEENVVFVRKSDLNLDDVMESDESVPCEDEAPVAPDNQSEGGVNVYLSENESQELNQATESEAPSGENTMAEPKLTEPKISHNVNLKNHGEHQFTLFWYQKDLESLENITCTRVNENLGSGVFKCVVKTRQEVHCECPLKRPAERDQTNSDFQSGNELPSEDELSVEDSNSIKEDAAVVDPVLEYVTMHASPEGANLPEDHENVLIYEEDSTIPEATHRSGESEVVYVTPESSNTEEELSGFTEDTSTLNEGIVLVDSQLESIELDSDSAIDEQSQDILMYEPYSAISEHDGILVYESEDSDRLAQDQLQEPEFEYVTPVPGSEYLQLFSSTTEESGYGLQRNIDEEVEDSTQVYIEAPEPKIADTASLGEMGECEKSRSKLSAETNEAECSEFIN